MWNTSSEEGQVLLQKWSVNVLFEVYPEAHWVETWSYLDITKNWGNEKNDWGNGHGSGETWLKHLRQRGPLQQTGDEGTQKVQWRSWQTWKVIPKNYGSTGNPTSKLIPNDERINW